MRTSGIAVRRLPYSAVQADGESLASWVDRTALLLDVERRDLWQHVGLTDGHQGQPVHYGVVLPPERRGAFITATGLQSAHVDALLLSSYSPLVVPWDRLDYANPDSVRTWARTAWVFVWPSHACPDCVRESGGEWQLRWKLPWSFACVKHGRYLMSQCPACGTRLQSNVLDARQSRICCGADPDPARARYDGRTRSRRHHDDICGAVVGDFDAPHAGGDACALQERIDHLLVSVDADESHSTLLDDLRRLTTFALYLGAPELLAGADSAVTDRFAEHAHIRDAAVPRRGHNAAAKYRQYSLPITDPLLAAGALTIAGRIAFADDLQGAWQEVMDTVFDNVPNAASQWWQLEKSWTPPPRHRDALERARTRRTFVISSLDGRARTRGAPHAADLDSRHVPALMWPAAHQFLADGLMERGWAVTARRFAALALARHLQPDLSDWSSAADALDLDPSCVASCHQWMGHLRREGTGRVFETRLDELTAALQQLPDRVDYRRRREVFTAFDLSDDDWTAIRTSAGIGATDKRWERRRHQVAVWLWETLTGGDWHHAPSLGLAQLPTRERQVASNAYVSYFKAKHLPAVQPSLTEFAAVLLKRDQLPGPVTMDVEIGTATA